MGFLKFTRKQKKTIGSEPAPDVVTIHEQTDQEAMCPIADTFMTQRKSISLFDDIMKELSEPLADKSPLSNNEAAIPASNDLVSRPPSIIRSASASVIKTPLPARPPSSHHHADSSDEGETDDDDDDDDEDDDEYDDFEELPVTPTPPSISSSSSSNKIAVPKPVLSSKVVMDRMKERHRLECRRSLYTMQQPPIATLSRQHSYPSMPNLVRPPTSGLVNVRPMDYPTPMMGYLPMNRFSSHENMVRSTSAYNTAPSFVVQDQPWTSPLPRAMPTPQMQQPLQPKKVFPPTPPPESTARFCSPSPPPPQPSSLSSSNSSTVATSLSSEVSVDRTSQSNHTGNPRLPPKVQQELQWMKLRRAQYSVPNLVALQEEEEEEEEKKEKEKEPRQSSKLSKSLPLVHEDGDSTKDKDSVRSVRQRTVTVSGDTPTALSYIHACPKMQHLSKVDNACQPPPCSSHPRPPPACSHHQQVCSPQFHPKPGSLTKSTSLTSITRSTNSSSRCKKHQHHQHHHHHHHHHYYYHYAPPSCQHHQQQQQPLCQQQDHVRAGFSGNDFVTA
ncbi:hypothetical protein DFQ28_000104 [Apophysomyces sp. BC1034]|nr:hypothetical protein DFQ30_006668 [Apophysomyces sp. BC1015]KAG0183234.1 hypothetical protein DFQ29_008594 [Apophysomyces sp. BC1021]KAG0194406.1 hypothetical protein DFQ28_000104 [Apophysomyces sp. BC1034]